MIDDKALDAACDAYVQIADDCMGLVRRKAMHAALQAAIPHLAPAAGDTQPAPAA